MEIDWKERITKYGYGINLETATDDDLTEYVETKMHLYTRSNLTDFALWTVFQEDFENFTPETFKRVQSNTRMGIRQYLVKRGVYVVKQDKRYSLGKVLTDVANEEEFHEWTDEELIAALAEVKPMITTTLQDRLNSTLDKLATPPAPPPATPPTPLAIPAAVPLATPAAVPPATPIAAPPATPITTPATPTTPPNS